MNISISLKQLRRQKGILQKELAAVLHCSVGTISNYEAGIHNPDLDTLVTLADYYGVSTDYLLGRSAIPSQQLIDIAPGYSLYRFVWLVCNLSETDRLLLADMLRLMERSNDIKNTQL